MITTPGEKRTRVLNLSGKLPVPQDVPCRRDLPVVYLIPPPAQPAPERPATELGAAVPVSPARESQGPERALDEREKDLWGKRTWCQSVISRTIGYG